MQTPLASLPPPPPELVFDGKEVPTNALFFDTNSALHPEVERAQQEGRPALISALVYAELITRRKGPKGLGIIDTLLIDRGLRVVPFDVLSARCFFDLNRRLQFDAPPLLRQNETERSCRDRLRFDLAVFAAALRHRALLITDNTRDFDHFPYRDYWKTRAEAFP
jgi:predicted nucleic acid-binding protein